MCMELDFIVFGCERLLVLLLFVFFFASYEFVLGVYCMWTRLSIDMEVAGGGGGIDVSLPVWIAGCRDRIVRLNK